MTPYRLEIDQVLKGTTPDGDAIHLLREGGRIGNVRFVVEDDPYSLEPGMRVLVFLRDGGEERGERFDTPAGQYRIVNRLTVTRDGDLEIAGHRYARSEVLGTVEAEKDLEPAREVPC